MNASRSGNPAPANKPLVKSPLATGKSECLNS